MEPQVSPVHLIIVAPPEIQKAVSARLTQVSMTCEVCDNVYLATALVFRNIKRRIAQRQLVVVWLDNLAGSQFDFFKLLDQSEVAVSIAISDSDENKLAYALERQAHRAVLLPELNARFINEILAPSVENVQPVPVAQPACECSQKADTAVTTDRSNDKNTSTLMENDISLSPEEIDSLLSDDTE